jgi:hypothetical protein
VPETVEKLSIEQIVANAGDGVLRDGSPCSGELREYLAQIPGATHKAFFMDRQVAKATYEKLLVE